MTKQPLPQALPDGCSSWGPVLWTFSPVSAPVLGHRQPLSGVGMFPSLELIEEWGHSPAARAWHGGQGAGLSEAQVSSVGSLGRQPVRTQQAC